MEINSFFNLSLDLVRRILVILRLIRNPNLIAKITEEYPHPDALVIGKIIVVQDGKRKKWACLRCPGGCGEKIQLSLNSIRHPYWIIRLDYLNRPSIHPSIRQLNTCRCHFFVKNGVVNWCSDSGHLNRQY